MKNHQGVVFFLFLFIFLVDGKQWSINLITPGMVEMKSQPRTMCVFSVKRDDCSKNVKKVSFFLFVCGKITMCLVPFTLSFDQLSTILLFVKIRTWLQNNVRLN